VGHIERFNPAVAAVQGRIGAVRFAECHRLSPFRFRATDVDVVMDLMIHDIDILLHLVQSPVARVEAVGVPILSEQVDIANARLVFANGCVANLTASRVSAKKQRKIRIFQEDAYLSMDFMEHTIQIFRRTWPQGKDGLPEITAELVETGKSDHLRDEIHSFVDCVRHGKRPRVAGEDGQAALEAAFRVVRNLKGS
jgi:predicted dehydrogenase